MATNRPHCSRNKYVAGRTFARLTPSAILGILPEAPAADSSESEHAKFDEPTGMVIAEAETGPNKENDPRSLA
jgi:hypothetical protein